MVKNARLINLFVTAFDSICDEIPEQLPETLTALYPIFQLFPQKNEPKIKSSRNLSNFTTSLANVIANEIGTSIRSLPEKSQDMLSHPVISAFENQLTELSINTVHAKDVMSVIDNKPGTISILF